MRKNVAVCQSLSLSHDLAFFDALIQAKQRFEWCPIRVGEYGSHMGDFVFTLTASINDHEHAGTFIVKWAERSIN